MAKEIETIDIRFLYDGFVRHVSNVTFEPETNSLIGFEMRKSGKFSFKIKRFSLDKINHLTYVEPFYRRGPVIGL